MAASSRLSLSLGYLFSGAISTLTLSLFFKTKVVIEGITYSFSSKNVFTVFEMFTGMSLLLIPRLCKRKSLSGSEDYALLGESSTISAKRRKGFMILAIPSTLVLFGCYLQAFGLILLAASVQTMLNSFLTVCTALLSKLVFKKKLGLRRIGAISLVMMGLVLLGFTTYLETGDAKSSLKGVLLTLLGCFLNAIAFVSEEYCIEQFDLSPVDIASGEGIIGLILSIATLILFSKLPGSDNGVIEDTPQTLMMLRHSPRAVLLLLGNMCILISLNYLGPLLTKKHGSPYRSVIESLRGVAVWVIGLIFTLIGFGGFEKLSSPLYTLMRVVSFGLAIFGAVIYSYAPDVNHNDDLAI